MKIIGFDPATCTGWSLLEVNEGVVKLLERGTIQPPSTFTLPQKLNFYCIEVKRLMEKHKPDYCAMEDLILGMSGVKILAYLARINGVIMQSCFECLKDNVRVYDPCGWKKNSFPNLTGKSHKWEVQIAVCKYFNLAVQGKFDEWQKKINDSGLQFQNALNEIVVIKKEMNEYKRQLNLKKKPEGYVEEEVIIKIAKLDDQHKAIKTSTKGNMKKFIDKQMVLISNDIHAQTGISNDIADSIGIAFCMAKELKVV